MGPEGHSFHLKQDKYEPWAIPVLPSQGQQHGGSSNGKEVLVGGVTHDIDNFQMFLVDGLSPQSLELWVWQLFIGTSLQCGMAGVQRLEPFPNCWSLNASQCCRTWNRIWRQYYATESYCQTVNLVLHIVTLFTLRQTSEELTPPLSDQVRMGLQVKCSEKWPFFHRSEQNLRFVSAVSFVVVKLFLVFWHPFASRHWPITVPGRDEGDDDPPLLSCKELAPSQLVRLKYRLTLNYTHSSASTDKGWKHGHPWFWRAVWQSQNSISAGKEPADASAECRFRKMSYRCTAVLFVRCSL